LSAEQPALELDMKLEVAFEKLDDKSPVLGPSG